MMLAILSFVFTTLRRPSEDSYRVRDDGRVEVQVFRRMSLKALAARAVDRMGKPFGQTALIVAL